jgi:hypothetical protein
VSKIYRSPSSTYYDGRAAINGLSGGLEARIDGFVERLEEGRPISFAGHHRGHTAGNDEIQVGDTKEAEERSKVWLHEIVGGHGRALAVDAARGDQEGYFLALQKTDRAGFSITERAARAKSNFEESSCPRYAQGA